MPELLAVGSLAYDDIATPVASGERLLGGSLSHFTLAAALAGAAPHLVAVVGEDFDQSDLDLLAALPSDTSGVERSPGKTFRWGGRYGDNFVGRETLFTELGVFADFTPALTPAFRESELVFLANIQPELQSRVLDEVPAPALVAMDTMNLWIDIALADLQAVVSRVDLLFINDEEARQLSGEASLMRAGRALQAMGPEHVMLKKGEHGVLLFSGETVYPCPSFPVLELVDPTGAGDAFAGGVMGSLAREGRWDLPALRRALLTGSVAGSFAVEGLGVQGLRRRSPEQLIGRREAFQELLSAPEL
jgi:sugar/nucleoside kinase (ribokinase family)